jgi:hypothetical protein
MVRDRLAIYTTIYPGVERYLSEWYRSVLSQTDTRFDLWIGVDSLNCAQIRAAFGTTPVAHWVAAEGQQKPAQVREAAMKSMIEEYDQLVFVDSDDLLYPSRVSAARKALRTHDVVACGLSIIDEGGRELGITFAPPIGVDFDSLLPRHNVFGLSNTAYRSEVLRHCLPFARDCELIDWLLATRAWASGASLHFDRTPRMAYRQHHANVARVLCPFSPDYVLTAAQKVLRHYGCLLEDGDALSERHRETLRTAQERAAIFYQSITESPARLMAYVQALNQLAPQYVWWWSVANPELEEIWKN